jgi:hypothetical protein
MASVDVRAVAQFGSALRSGRRGPRFKSGQPDQKCRSAGVLVLFDSCLWQFVAILSRSLKPSTPAYRPPMASAAATSAAAGAWA